RWLEGSLQPAGRLVIDTGAMHALARGSSLLPAGVRSVEGVFERGDLVLVLSETQQLLGRGLTAYGSTDAARIIGHRSDAIEALLGWRGRDEMIHRDDLVLDAN
ncbi:MAG: PUA domain-containing protein, partial [Janthinobacterium lividum]